MLFQQLNGGTRTIDGLWQIFSQLFLPIIIVTVTFVNFSESYINEKIN